MQIKCDKRIEKLEELISESIFIFRRYINIINIVNKYCKFLTTFKSLFFIQSRIEIESFMPRKISQIREI